MGPTVSQAEDNNEANQAGQLGYVEIPVHKSWQPILRMTSVKSEHLHVVQDVELMKHKTKNEIRSHESTIWRVHCQRDILCEVPTLATGAGAFASGPALG